MNERRALNIILVDDEPSVLLALRLLIQTLGHTVREFNRGADALEYLRGAGESDLVMCDLRMPGMDGLQVLSGVRELAPSLPFVLISGHATEEDMRRAKQLGASGVLTKPFTPDELRGVLARVAEGR